MFYKPSRTFVDSFCLSVPYFQNSFSEKLVSLPQMHSFRSVYLTLQNAVILSEFLIQVSVTGSL